MKERSLINLNPDVNTMRRRCDEATPCAVCNDMPVHVPLPHVPALIRLIRFCVRAVSVAHAILLPQDLPHPSGNVCVCAPIRALRKIIQRRSTRATLRRTQTNGMPFRGAYHTTGSSLSLPPCRYVSQQNSRECQRLEHSILYADKNRTLRCFCVACGARPAHSQVIHFFVLNNLSATHPSASCARPHNCHLSCPNAAVAWWFLFDKP